MRNEHAAEGQSTRTRSAVEVPAVVNSTAGIVVNSALRIHKRLGPGLLESAYERCLEWELLRAGLKVDGQAAVPLQYEGLRLENAFRADMLVSSEAGLRLLVEIKAVKEIEDVHRAQVLTYLRLLDLPIGLLVNFNVPLIRDGINRMLNTHWRPNRSTS